MSPQRMANVLIVDDQPENLLALRAVTPDRVLSLTAIPGALAKLCGSGAATQRRAG